MPDAFRIDDNVVFLSSFPVVDDIVDQLLLVIIVVVRQKQILRANGQTCPERNIPGVSAHHFDDADPLMGCRCIPYLIDRLHRRIDRRIKSDRIFRAGDIKIDRSGYADRSNAQVSQCAGAGKRAVPADHDQAVYPVLFTDLSRLLLYCKLSKFQASGGIQDRAALADGLGNIAGRHINDLLI